jgi:predicted dehydrogenase
VDVIDIVTPTSIINVKVAIKSGKHVFIEKPISNTIEEAEEIIALLMGIT